MHEPVRLAFLGCGFITAVHSRHLRALDADAVCSYASRDLAKADAYCRRFGGARAYASYDRAIDDPTVARRLKTAGDWRNDEATAGGDAFFEEGVHWLHLANSLGPRITRITAFRPGPPRRSDAAVADRRLKTMMVAFQYDNSAAGTLF